MNNEIPFGRQLLLKIKFLFLSSVMYTQYGFLYLILTRRKFTVQLSDLAMFVFMLKKINAGGYVGVLLCT